MRKFGWLLILIALASLVAAAPDGAQAWQGPAAGVYHPLHHGMPPGVVARQATTTGRVAGLVMQAVQLELPGAGVVTAYDSVHRAAHQAPAPTMFRGAVGYTYRLRISDMPAFPGVELYPSVEILDRLHPPPGQELRFPIPVPITEEEIELALAGQLVTKVIYLEQPQLAVPQPPGSPLRTTVLPQEYNLLAVADQAGRPLLILRLGGRLPVSGAVDPDFYGNGGPLQMLPATTRPQIPQPAVSVPRDSGVLPVVHMRKPGRAEEE